MNVHDGCRCGLCKARRFSRAWKDRATFWRDRWLDGELNHGTMLREALRLGRKQNLRITELEKALHESEIEPLQVGKTYRVNPAGSHTIDNGRGQPIQVDVEPFDRPARRRAPDHDSMGPMK